jgi:ATP-dependent helicase/nuclease subunit A
LSGLTIYKASAGSGKTFALARDYISLVIQDPEIFRHILAVTFTNKATDEMKGRILDELFRLASGTDSSIRTEILEQLKLDSEEVSARARIILETILHNYSRFHIETIDRFFQRAIRAFTKEIGLAAGYEVELDAPHILSEAIDMMLDGLDRDTELQKWFVEFAREKVQEGKNWNLKNDLLILGAELNNERFQEDSTDLVTQLSDKEGFSRFQSALNSIKFGFERSLEGMARDALKMMSEEGLNENDFKGAYGVGWFFSRILRGDYKPPSDTIMNAADTPENWYARGSEAKDRILRAYDRGLNDFLKRIIGMYDNDYRKYMTAGSVRSFLYTLGILTDISARMQEYTLDQGIFLLSDAARFLYGIIGENEAPFIYEKIGNYFHHFMIDEFQDTSGLQWKNFKPLIDNSLAYNNKCLIVGDVKQSIYRWRNSDWEILSEVIPRAFNPSQIEEKELKHNWRSRRNIVSFNNDFFTSSRDVLKEFFQSEGEDGEQYPQKINRAYGDVTQLVPDIPGKDGGYVRINMIRNEKGGDWKSVVHGQVVQVIEQLQDRGLTLSDIAILVRTKREGKEISDAILLHKSLHPESRYRYDMISNESLFLGNALSVRIIAGVLKYMTQPGDRINLAQLIYEHRLFNEGEAYENDFLESGADGLPAAFLEQMNTLRYLTLTELIERIIRLFALHRREEETAYLLAFQDIILDYSRNNPADINSFLSWWDEHGEDVALTVSEDQDAIRVMTIHKAKGLQFPAVIIPYCHWSFDHRGLNAEILWCKPEESPFNQLSLLPVKYSSVLKDTYFEKEYNAERFRVYVDHLNLMYVAFTRAMEGLFIFAPLPARDKLTDAADLLHKILSGFTNDEHGVNWSSGDFHSLGRTGEAKESGQLLISHLHSHEFAGKLRLQYRGTTFFDTRAEQRINQGNLMHELFSRIRSTTDITKAIEAVRREGMIETADAEQLKREIISLIEYSDVMDWFDGRWKVIAEQDILTPAGTLKRPDRVMLKDDRVIVVDYKFGRQQSPSHRSQVKKYTEMLKEMNYGEVKGFIWYVNLKEVVEV